MLQLLFILVLIALSSPPAVAQNGNLNLVNLSPLQAYDAIKTVMRENYGLEKTYDHESWKDWTNMLREIDTFDLEQCAISCFNVDHRRIQSTAITIAQKRLDLENDLRVLGIPLDVLRPHLTSLDQIGIDALKASSHSNSDDNAIAVRFDQREKEVMYALLEALTHYRSKHPDLPLFIYDGGCGAGEESAELVSNRQLVTFSYAPFCNFRFCELAGIAPEDMERCTGWTTLRMAGRAQIPIDEGTPSGVYRYVAKMPGGDIKRGEFYASPEFNGEVYSVSVDLK